MNRRALTFFLIVCSEFLFAQTDTLIVYDYTKVMVTTEIEKGTVTPVTKLEELSQAGFFLHSIPKGLIRVCNTSETYIWVNGRLVKKIHECDFVDPKTLYDEGISDTVFVSFTVGNSFENFKCELVRFEELQVLQEEVLLSKSVRDNFTEFIIIVNIIILSLFGVFLSFYPSRVSFIARKTFSLKANTYEFINTSFLSPASLNAMIIFSMLLGFLSVYLNELLGLSILNRSQNTLEFILSWLQFSLIVFATLFVKRLLIDLIAKMFYFKGWKNYQIFDFINFNVFVFSFFSLFVVIDFICLPTSESLITRNILLLFPIALIMFLVWFSLKFVNHSSHKKLVLISYLCATEIIPAVFLLGWFFK